MAAEHQSHKRPIADLMLTAACFLLAAMIALRSVWHDIELRWIGYALIFSNITSELVYYCRLDGERAAVYTLSEIGIDFLVFIAFYTRCLTNTRRRWECRLLIGTMIVSTISICANIALACLLNPLNPDRNLIYSHTLITNIMYVLECLFTITIGITSGVRINHFSRWGYDRRKSVINNDMRKELEGMDK